MQFGKNILIKIMKVNVFVVKITQYQSQILIVDIL